MNIKTIFLSLFFSSLASFAYADCNDINWQLDNTGNYTWNLTLFSCHPGDSNTPVQTLSPQTSTYGVGTGDVGNGVACEIRYERADNPNINFSISINQNFCLFEGGDNNSKVLVNNGAGVSVTSITEAQYKNSIPGGVLFTLPSD